MFKMNRYLVLLAVAGLFLARQVGAQGTFKPRNADEAHAWRLYNQYRESKQKAINLQIGITKKQEDIRTVGQAGMGGTFAIDPQDVADLTRMREQLAAEKDRQQKLEQAWDKKFWGRYGDLKDSARSIYDPKTKQNMDRIQFRLIYFPFYVLDGTYTGRITGAPGTITLTVNGKSVKGRASGTYHYTFAGKKYSDPFSGVINGTLGDGGSIQANLSGKIGSSAYTGRLTGSITKGQASGSWTAKSLTTASGSWSAKKK